MGLEEAGVAGQGLRARGPAKVSRTTAPGVYAAGDVTGVFALASVAAMQGRIAMYHFLGDAVAPAEPEDRLVQRLHRPRDRHRRLLAGRRGRGQDRRPGRQAAPAAQPPRQDAGHPGRLRQDLLPPGTGIIVGGVVVAPRASELIHPISIAVDNNLTVEQIANAFTVYPSLLGSIAEVARQLHTRKAGDEG